MKKTFGYFLVVALIIHGVAVSASPKACEYSDFCVQPNMPLLSNSYPEIAQEFTRLMKLENPSHPGWCKDGKCASVGWCGIVANTMVLSGLLKGSGRNFKHSSDYSGASFISHDGKSMRQLILDYGQVMFNIGKTTDDNLLFGKIKKSGHEKIDSAYENVWKKALAHSKRSKNIKSKFVSKNGTWSKGKYGIESSFISVDEIKSLFQADMPALTLHIETYQYDKKTNNPVLVGGHSVAVNGYEDNYLKIYDSWGSVYNVELVKAKNIGIPFGDSTILKFVNGDNLASVKHFGFAVLLGYNAFTARDLATFDDIDNETEIKEQKLLTSCLVKTSYCKFPSLSHKNLGIPVGPADRVLCLSKAEELAMKCQSPEPFTAVFIKDGKVVAKKRFRDSLLYYHVSNNIPLVTPAPLDNSNGPTRSTVLKK